jgi:hypothetical protein
MPAGLENSLAFLCQGISHDKPYVMAGVGIFIPDISKSCYQVFHDVKIVNPSEVNPVKRTVKAGQN